MRVSFRLRRDFTVTDAPRLLAEARRAYLRLTPGATEQDAAAEVTCAADVVFVLLEEAGLIGGAADAALATYESLGLEVGGHRSQVIPDEPWPLHPRGDCLRHDVFALPTAGGEQQP